MKQLFLATIVCASFFSTAHASVSALEVIQDMQDVLGNTNTSVQGTGLSNKGDRCQVYIGSSYYDLRVRAEAISKTSDTIKTSLDSGLVINDYDSKVYQNVAFEKYEISEVKNDILSVKIEAIESFPFNTYTLRHSVNIEVKKGKIVKGGINTTLVKGELKTDLEKLEIGSCTVK